MSTLDHALTNLLDTPVAHKVLDLQVQTMGGGGKGPVDIDITFFIYLALFFVTWFGLKNMLFDPYMRTREAREAATTGTKEEASSLKVDAEESLKNYETQLKAAREEAETLRTSIKQEAETKQKQALEEAYADSAAKLSAHRDALEGQIDEARKELRSEAKTLSSLIVKQLLPSA